MLNKLGKLILTATAISPFFLTYGAIAFLKCEICKGIKCIAVFITCCVLLYLLIRDIRKNSESFPLIITSVGISDGNNLAFLLLYLMPFLSGRHLILDLKVIVPALIVYGIAVMTSYSYHFNPLMGILWHFYKVDSRSGVTYILITKKHLLKKTDETPILVRQLTEYVLIDMGDSNGS